MTILEFDALGTAWWIDSATRLPDRVVAEIRDRVEGFDRTYSRFRHDSLVAAVSRTQGVHEFPPEAAGLFALYRQLYDSTGGSVTPLIGCALEHLGYDPAYRLRRRPGSVAVPRWEGVLDVEGSTITTTEPLLLDFGAAGKGLLVDELAALLHTAGMHDFLIDGSGDLRHSGRRPCVIALQDPVDPTRAIGTTALRDNAVAASSAQRRRWGPDLHHIVDPATGESTTAVIATWAIADTGMLADGLSTALFFAPPAALSRTFAFQWVRILASGQVEHSADFAGDVFRQPMGRVGGRPVSGAPAEV